MKDQRVIVYAFAIMNTHIHLIWQMQGGILREDVQRDFLKYTGQQVLKSLRNERSALLEELVVDKKDRLRQVWKRNSLSISLWSRKVFDQKLNYIHENPVQACLCEYAEQYKYSSAAYYLLNDESWDFITHAGN